VPQDVESQIHTLTSALDGSMANLTPQKGPPHNNYWIARGGRCLISTASMDTGRKRKKSLAPDKTTTPSPFPIPCPPHSIVRDKSQLQNLKIYTHTHTHKHPTYSMSCNNIPKGAQSNTDILTVTASRRQQNQ